MEITGSNLPMRDFVNALPRVLVSLALAGSLATASRADEFRLEDASLPAPLLEGDRPNVIIEASGVEPIGDGQRFLVAHDKAPALYVVDAKTGRLAGPPITSPRFPRQTKTGPKWEGMALDSDGNYYIVGSHSGKTDPERSEKAELLRFRLTTSATPSIDDASVVRWRIERGLVAALKAAGLNEQAVSKRKIEGLTVRETKTAGGTARKELIVGLREPGDRVRAFVADITREPVTDAELELKPLFAFEAEPREGVESQLTSLEYVPALAGFLIVTASEDEGNAFHGNTLWFVADSDSARARKLAVFEVAMKAEGLAVLGTDTRGARTDVRLLITFDNDAHSTKMPSRFQTVTLVRDRR
jgi:hypothetical protein